MLSVYILGIFLCMCLIDLVMCTYLFLSRLNLHIRVRDIFPLHAGMFHQCTFSLHASSEISYRGSCDRCESGPILRSLRTWFRSIQSFYNNHNPFDSTDSERTHDRDTSRNPQVSLRYCHNTFPRRSERSLQRRADWQR